MTVWQDTGGEGRTPMSLQTVPLSPGAPSVRGHAPPRQLATGLHQPASRFSGEDNKRVLVSADLQERCYN